MYRALVTVSTVAMFTAFSPARLTSRFSTARSPSSVFMPSGRLMSLSVHATPQEALLESVLSLGEKAVTDSGYKPGILRHIVLFRYNETVVDEVKKKDIIKKFLNLATDCRRNGNPYIISIETGSQNSAEGADQNLEQGFLVTFKSEGDRNYYVGKPIVNGTGFFDPAHDEFKKFVGPLLHNQGGALVFDFNVEEKKSEFM